MFVIIFQRLRESFIFKRVYQVQEEGEFLPPNLKTPPKLFLQLHIGKTGTSGETLSGSPSSCSLAHFRFAPEFEQTLQKKKTAKRVFTLGGSEKNCCLTTKGKCKVEQKQIRRMFKKHVTSCDVNFHPLLRWSETTKMAADKSSVRYVWTADTNDLKICSRSKNKRHIRRKETPARNKSSLPPLSSALV